MGARRWVALYATLNHSVSLTTTCGKSLRNRVRSEAGNDPIAGRSGLFARIGNDPREEKEGSSLRRAQIIAVQGRWIARQTETPREVDPRSFGGSAGWYLRRIAHHCDGGQSSSWYRCIRFARQAEDPRKAEGGSLRGSVGQYVRTIVPHRDRASPPRVARVDRPRGFPSILTRRTGDPREERPASPQARRVILETRKRTCTCNGRTPQGQLGPSSRSRNARQRTRATTPFGVSTSTR